MNQVEENEMKKMMGTGQLRKVNRSRMKRILQVIPVGHPMEGPYSTRELLSTPSGNELREMFLDTENSGETFLKRHVENGKRKRALIKQFRMEIRNVKAD